jgi:hypothetical protein
MIFDYFIYIYIYKLCILGVLMPAGVIRIMERAGGCV